MVRETKTLGDGVPGTTNPAELPTVKNVVVYESTRQIRDWELAAVAEKIGQLSNNHKFFHKMQELLGREVANQIDTKGNKSEESRSKTFYHMLMTYRKRQTYGLLEVGVVARMLHNIDMRNVAESIQP